MEANLLEESLNKDVRFKNLKKRSKSLSKRLDLVTKNENALYSRIRSMGNHILVIPEVIKFVITNSGIVKSLSENLYEFRKEVKSIKKNGADGLPYTPFDRYIAHKESCFVRWEESMDKAEAAQVRIKELLDSLEKS